MQVLGSQDSIAEAEAGTSDVTEPALPWHKLARTPRGKANQPDLP